LAQEDQLFELDIDGQDEKLPVAEGRLDEAFARLGRVRLRNPRDSREQLIETIFLQFVSEDNEFAELSDLDRSTLRNSTPLIPGGRVNSLALGIEWDLPVLTGRGFDLSGHRQRASLFTSSSRWASDVSYSQIYLSSRWNLRLNDDWRLLLRGEAAYSDAEVRELTFEREGLQVEVSLTELPVRYRFKAGGGFSVRGYGYESLSNNGLGSNHLLTGSVELERRLVGDWSVSTFFDTGNAFNDWSQPGLRKGAGLGVRWYALGFPLRLDVASALDLPGNPWRLHLTLGTTLF
ncbi:MAG: BamA/TamA family outer membrane protein, partial [Xanthomonadales bacterium]|nr:BamA/TamA family outer membrane protein [Xanthomonadales bacterium]